MKSTIALASALLVASAAPASAQPAQPAPPPATRTLGVDGLVLLPTGDYGRYAELGFGGLGRLELPMSGFVVTGRAGVILHLTDADGTSLTYVPIYAGIRYPIAQSGLFLAAELGLTLAYATVDTPFGSGSDSDTEVGGTFGVGLRSGGLTFQGGLIAPDFGDAVGFGGSVGFDLASF